MIAKDSEWHNSKIVHYLFKVFLSFLCYTTYMISSSESVRPDIEISEGGYLS